MSRININEILAPSLNLGGESKRDSVSEKFLSDVQCAISKYNKINRRKSSMFYKPSSLVCDRQMFYQRTGAEADDKYDDYKGIGMADTGTRRHVAIQEILEVIDKLGYEWEYLDVADYVEKKHNDGKILDTKVSGTRGHETHLVHATLHVSCMCDGIIRNTKTNEYYLFEFKNQISFKAGKHARDIDSSHEEQIVAYCTLLDLDKVLMLYENRDTCELYCPNVYHVGEGAKKAFKFKLIEVERYVINNIIPKANKGCSMCKWCNYKTLCEKHGVNECSNSSE